MTYVLYPLKLIKIRYTILLVSVNCLRQIQTYFLPQNKTHMTVRAVANFQSTAMIFLTVRYENATSIICLHCFA